MARVLIQEGEEGEIGGVVRNHPPKHHLAREGPGRKKTPRHQVPQMEEPAVELPAVVVVKPPEEKKEVKEMESNVPVKDKKIPFPVPGFAICPMCGQYSKHDDKPYFVCKGCDDKYHAYVKRCDEEYQIYADKVAAEIAGGGNPTVQPKVVQSKFEWILARLDIAAREKELADARITMELHNGRYRRRAERIAGRVQAKANGKVLTQQVLMSLRNLYEKEVNQEDGETAKNDIALVRYLNTWRIATTKLKSELELMIAEAAKKTAEAVTANAAEATPAVSTTALATVPEHVVPS